MLTPAHFVTAVERLAGAIGAEVPGARPLVVGDPGRAVVAAIERGLAARADVVSAPADGRLPEVEDGAAQVVVALDWLPRLVDPEVGLAELVRVGAPHRLLGAPREPFAALGVHMTTRLLSRLGQEELTGGRSWSAPGFARLVSHAGAICAVAHPVPWNLAWVRAR